MFISILYNSSITDIEHFPNYTTFSQSLTTKWDNDNNKLLLYIYK